MITELTLKNRWYRWDLLFLKGKYDVIIQEYDELSSLNQVKSGCYVYRKQALEELGILDFNEFRYKKIYQSRQRF